MSQPQLFEFPITTVWKLTSKDFSDLLITFVEGGGTYWCDHLLVSDDLSYQDEDLFLKPDVTITITHGEEYGEEEKVTRSIAEIIEATGKCSPIDMDNFDAETADVWIQTVFLGEVTYG